MRPNRRAIMPSTVALISSIGVSMLASIALIQSSRVQLRKSPGGGPPALVIRISGWGKLSARLSRPPRVVMSQATAVTVTPVFKFRRFRRGLLPALPAPRAINVTWTPSAASAWRRRVLDPCWMRKRWRGGPFIPRSTISLPLRQMTLQSDVFTVASRHCSRSSLTQVRRPMSSGPRRPKRISANEYRTPPRRPIFSVLASADRPSRRYRVARNLSRAGRPSTGAAEVANR